MIYELKTQRLILRPLNIRDLDTVHAYASDIENTKYMLHLPNETIEETSRFLKRVSGEWQKAEPEFFEFAIILDGKQIGAVSVYLNEVRTEGEMGWILDKGYWGNGYATEAAMAVKDFALDELKVFIIVAHCDSRNLASRKVMEKLGLILVKDDGIRQYPKTAEFARELMYSYSI